MPRPAKTLAEVQKMIDGKWPAMFQVLTYTGTPNPADFRCLKCFTEFARRPHDVLRRGACPGCSPAPGTKSASSARARARKAAEAGGVRHVSSEISGRVDRRLRHIFSCPQHGEFALTAPGDKAVCPKCRGHISPNDPDSLPTRLRGKPCDLYLIEIQDTTGGYFTKVGISTNWACRKRNYAKEGVRILREVRCIRMTLYEALLIERELKKWMRRTLGRRRCPRKKWSGWSESAIDPFRKFPAAFDREVTMFRARRRRD